MALMRDLSRSQLAFQVSGRDVDLFQVTRYSGAEGLCQLYCFEIEVACAEQGVALQDIVGKSATLSIYTGEGARVFHGIVARFEMSGETANQTYFRAELVPQIWLLTHRYSSRIFQGKTIKEIITDVLTRGGIPSDRFSFLLNRTYAAREYCVQYRETDYNFISRLMEEEGIRWYFEHTTESHKFVMEDSASTIKPITGDPKLPYHPPSGLRTDTEHVFRFRISQSVRPGSVVLNDFNFESPKLSLEAKADSGRDTALEFADFPGEYGEQGRGNELAKLRAEEFEAGRIAASGQANCSRIAPGHTFELIEHPTTAFNGKYLITGATHSGKQAVLRTTTGTEGRGGVLDARLHQALVQAQSNDNVAIRELASGLLQIASRLRSGDPTARRALAHWLYHAGQVTSDLAIAAAAYGENALQWLTLPNLIEDIAQSSLIDYDAPIYECSFECMPAATPFRPARITPWPEIAPQTARVVGPQGEEIHTDKYGRVRVQFHWDREGNEGGQPKLHGADSSCWIRVSQGMAGGAYGMMFIPRVGQEVVVDFLEGNPDCPLIVGRVFNADHMPPYELPKHKTRSVIKTHSSTGGGGTNEIRFEDLKDKEQLFIQAQRQMDLRVKASHYHSVGGSYHLMVGGEYNGELSGEYRQLVYKAKHVHIKGEMRTWIEEDENRAITKNLNLEVQGARSTSVGGDDISIADGNMQRESSKTVHVKGNDVKIEATGTIELTASGQSIVLASGGIYIVGSKVFINSGSGPTVSPVAGGMSPAAAEDPGGADSSEPGKDTRYSGSSTAPPELTPLPEVPGHEFKELEPPPSTWIDIDLHDQFGEPVPHEPYRVKDSAGRIFTGSLDDHGFAHVVGVAPGVCEIRFPRRDLTVWRRA